MSRPKTKRYTVAIVEVPWDLIVGKTATKKALRDPASHVQEDIELVFDDRKAVIRDDLRVSIAEVL